MEMGVLSGPRVGGGGGGGGESHTLGMVGGVVRIWIGTSVSLCLCLCRCLWLSTTAKGPGLLVKDIC
jgi:hypothetical protein